jgi:pyruvate-ferredoxin/flavodoxin oxidoreductase
VSKDAPKFVQEVTAEIMALRGDELPTSKMPIDGKWPTGTTKFEKRNIAVDIPVWEPTVCIQCGTCSFVCPHGTIRLKAYDKKYLEKAPKTFKSAEAKGKELRLKFRPMPRMSLRAMCPAGEARKKPTGRRR